MIRPKGSGKKNAAAVELGRKGGSVKVPKGFSKLSKKQRVAMAKKAARARWGKKRAQ